MNFTIPDEKEIRTAFGEGEEAVVALFGGVTARLKNLLIIWISRPEC
jgi:hypothetical protein